MLVPDTVWDDFQLSLDFKISPKCNSGVFIRTFPLTPHELRDQLGAVLDTYPSFQRRCLHDQ